MPIKFHEIKLNEVVEFLGKRSIFTLACSIVTGMCLAAVDLVFAALIEVLLVHMSGAVGKYQTNLSRFGYNLDLNSVLIAVAAISVGRGIAQYFVSICADSGRISISTKLWAMTIRHSLAISKNYVTSAELTRRISDLQPKMEAFVQLSSALISKIIYVAAILCALLMSAWRESILFLIGLAGLGFILLPLNAKVRKSAREFKSENDSLIVRVQNIVRNRLLVHVFMTEQQEETRMTQSILRRSTAEFSTRKFANLGFVTPLAVGPILLCLVIYVQNAFWPSDLLTLGAVFYLFIRFAQTFAAVFADISNLNARWPSVQDCYLSYRKLECESVLNVVRRTSCNVENSKTNSTAPVTIEIKNLDFSFPSGPKTFQNFNLTISPGQHYGIVGSTGVGKSTLLALVSGLENPKTGIINIDGYTPSDFRNKSLKKVRYVSSEPFFFEGTIKDNLCYGLKDSVSADDILRLVEVFELSDVVKPHSLNDRIDENCVGFSTGQKQKLSMIRALLSKPQLLLLDEASSNLDFDAERKIAGILKNLHGECTILNVSHRRGFLIHADRVVDLNAVNSSQENNKIIAVGL